MSTQKAVKNTLFNWISLIVSNILTFILRTYLINYLGTEILGVNATIAETLNLLSMMELGIQTSITYRIYKPIIEGDKERQGQLINLYKVAYRVIGLGILVIGLLVSPIVPRIVNAQIDINIIYAAYFIQLLAIVINYLTSYYKLLYIVYQKQYIINICNILLSIILFILQLLILTQTRNYLLYLVSSYITLLLTYIFFRVQSKKDYPDILCKIKTEKADIVKLFSDTKEMIVAQISGYIYGSTDNILISFFFGSFFTGLISNYRVITRFIRSMLAYMSNAISPTWGDFLYRENNKEKAKDYYSITIFIEYCLCSVLLIPTLLLIDDFVYKIWLRNENMLIDPVIYILIIADIFLTNLGEPNCIIMRNFGMFREEKKISFWGMVTNLVSSIILVKIMGLQGIFIGTLLAVVVFWIGRSHIINRSVFNNTKKKYVMFWINNLAYVASFVGLSWGLYYLIRLISIENPILDFVCKGIIIEIIVSLFIIVIWGNSKQFIILRIKIRDIFQKNRQQS